MKVLRCVLAAGLLVGVLVVRTSVASDGNAQPPPTPRGRESVAPVVPNGVGDTDHLQPAVRRAVDRAIAAAAAQGVELRVTSGWRSRSRQQRLYDDAVAKYGSPERARRWVLPPDESEHVRGGAVDVGPESGARWLEVNGVRFGLCRRYDNEPWHFERLAGPRGSVCPPREAHA